MAEGSAELELFRRRWREELAAGGKRRRREAAEGPDGLGRDGSGCLALACSLLDGESPAPRSPPPARPCEEAAGDETDDLLGQLIRDLVGRAAGRGLSWHVGGSRPGRQNVCDAGLRVSRSPTDRFSFLQSSFVAFYFKNFGFSSAPY